MSRRDEWTDIDDIPLPQRLAETGVARSSFFENILNRTEQPHTERNTGANTHPAENWGFGRADMSRNTRQEPDTASEGSEFDDAEYEETFIYVAPADRERNTAGLNTVARSPRRSPMPFGFIDLTDTPNPQRTEDTTMPATLRPRRDLVTRDASTEDNAGPSAAPAPKRRRRNDGTRQDTSSGDASSGNGTQGQSQSQSQNRSHIAAIDLSQDDEELDKGLVSTLQKQRQDAVKAQLGNAEEENKPIRMGGLTCIICLDPPKDLTATSCGHWFCHTCLMEALIAGENRAGPGEARRSQCPVCRKTLNRNKASDVFPLLAKKGAPAQPTRKKLKMPKED